MSGDLTTVVMMTRLPRIGTVKTRLASEIGSARALRIYRQMVEAQIGRIPPEFNLEIHYTPASGEREMREWLGDRPGVFPQVDELFGERLHAATAAAFGRGATKVLLIGGDCPGLTATVLHEADRLLDSNDLAVGPALDGGYYLLGMRKPDEHLFSGVTWGTPQVLEETISRAAARRLTFEMLPKLEDVDDAASLDRAIRAGLVSDSD